MSFWGKVKKAVNAQIIKVLRTKFPRDYMRIFSSLYDEMLIRPFNFNQDDRTAPIYLKQDVLAYVEQSILEAVNSLDPNGPLVIDAIPHSVLYRMPSRTETDSVRLFYFYLVGTPGKFVVLRREDYEHIFPFKRGADISLGRFGNMHMLPYEKYSDMYNSVPSNFSRNWPHPDSIIHPFSGAPPIRIFEAANDAVIPLIKKYFNMKITIGVKK